MEASYKIMSDAGEESIKGFSKAKRFVQLVVEDGSKLMEFPSQTGLMWE